MRQNTSIRICFTIIVTCLLWCAPVISQETDATTRENADTIIRESFNQIRGKASEASVKMTIHRPDWERSMSINAWTQGQENSLIRITAPAKDKGNGTLKKGREMWMYNPKINRVIKLPPSMMSQAWMGSDFSNNDLAKSDTLLKDYTHELVGKEKDNGKTVYIIKSTPKPQAPVIWGMQKLKIREDFIMLRNEFYDEDNNLVKYIVTSDIRMMGGRLFPATWKMVDNEKKDHYTILDHKHLTFKDHLPDSVFTLSRLKNPEGGF